MAGRAHGGTPRRGPRQRRLPVLLLLFLPVAFVPRASLVSHHHHGGSLPHVHLDAPEASGWIDFSHSHEHAHEHEHEHEYPHESGPEAGSLRERDAPALFAADTATPHWHTQAPFLVGLPNPPPVLPALPATSAPPRSVPGDPAAAIAALPCARGPPRPPLRPPTSVS